MKAKVDREDFQGHIVVVHLVIAESHINIDGVEVLVLHQKFLVNLSGLFKVTTQVVKCRHAQLIFDA